GAGLTIPRQSRWALVRKRESSGSAAGRICPLAYPSRIVHHVAPTMPLENVFVIDHPVIQTKLTELRDVGADHRKFRTLLDEIAGLMVYEVTRDWPTKPHPIRTPLEETTGRVLARDVTLVPILRAGLGMA